MTYKLIEPIHGSNLSEAWAKAFVVCWHARRNVFAPGIVSFNIDEENRSWNLETPSIRRALDEQLDKFNESSEYHGKGNIETVSNTIFPESIWKRCQGDRQELFDEYRRMWPFIKKCRQNRRGTYFKRLIAYDDPGNPEKTNQLKKIIEKWESKNHNHSALQAGVFDPCQDHINTKRTSFPCLQQVAFHPHGKNGKEGMSLVAFYANQLLLEKAYGNYLGLFRLGRFMAGEMGLKFCGVTCIASNLKLSDRSGKKRDNKEFTKFLEKELADAT